MHDSVRDTRKRKVLAPAKVNLHLAVGDRREDGFHAIESVFARTDLCDELEVELRECKEPQVEVRGLEGLCDPGKDTMSKAAWLWMQRRGIPLAICITCTKRIPSQAGLGGGSSDAASLLLLLDALFPGEADTLWEIGLQVGSDVPFFLSRTRIAWVTGRGEFVEPIEDVRPLFGMLVMPGGLKCATREAYEALDQTPRPSFQGKSRIEECLRRGPSGYAGFLRNDFFEVVGSNPSYDLLLQASEGLDGYGALSGSGSCWFFVSENQESVARFSARLGSMAGRFDSWNIRI